MTYRHMQRTSIGYTLFRDPQAMLYASTSVSRSRLSGVCRGTTLGKTGSVCIVLVRTSRRLLLERHRWECGCPFTTKSGMETSQSAKTGGLVLRRIERDQVKVTRNVVRLCSKVTHCRGRSGTMRCGTTMTESIMYSLLKDLLRYTVRHPPFPWFRVLNYILSGPPRKS
jgi:hypothetical protein